LSEVMRSGKRHLWLGGGWGAVVVWGGVNPGGGDRAAVEWGWKESAIVFLVEFIAYPPKVGIDGQNLE